MPSPSQTSNIITAITGTGPMTAVDLATIPEEVKLQIIRAAINAAVFIGDGDISAAEENSSAEEATVDLVVAVNKLDELHRPIIPGPPHASIGDLQTRTSYPIIREGYVVQVPRAELTPFEKHVVTSWLRVQGWNSLHHADELAGTPGAPGAKATR